MTLTTDAGKRVEIPDYIMKCLNEFGNTTVSDKLIKKFGGKDGLIRAFRNSGVNVWIRIVHRDDLSTPIVELL